MPYTKYQIKIYILRDKSGLKHVIYFNKAYQCISVILLGTL